MAEQINTLLDQSKYLLSNITIDFKRFLFDEIKWKNRLIGIKGARGTGKTMLSLQWLKQQKLPVSKDDYFLLDYLYFTNHSLKETVAQFYILGGKIMVFDSTSYRLQKQPNWILSASSHYSVNLFP